VLVVEAMVEMVEARHLLKYLLLVVVVVELDRAMELLVVLVVVVVTTARLVELVLRVKDLLELIAQE
jgi:hypothetical protein